MSPYCYNCGAEVEDSWKICPNCGKDLKESHVPQPQPTTQVQPPSQQPETVKKTISSGGQNLYGAVALICGVVGLIVSFVMIGIFVGLLAIVLGGIGISKDENNTMAVIGLILGIIDLVVAIIIFLFIFAIFSWLSFLPW
ncbi:MAG: zinc-ribbon domain-containing protein [Candidatus Thorarchaeota archaeon]